MVLGNLTKCQNMQMLLMTSCVEWTIRLWHEMTNLSLKTYLRLRRLALAFGLAWAHESTESDNYFDHKIRIIYSVTELMVMEILVVTLS